MRAALVVVVIVVVVVVLAMALGTRLFNLSAALLCLTAVLAMATNRFLKVGFGFTDALFALVVVIARLRRHDTHAQQERSKNSRGKSLTDH